MAHVIGGLQSLCDILSGAVIVLCLILKLPQIFAILRERSSRGISIYSVLLELSGYTIILSYHCAMSYPLLTYLEFCFLVPQDLLLLTVILQHQGKLNGKVLAAFLLYCSVAYALAQRMVPDIMLQLIIGCVTPLSVSSKLLQILKVLKLKDAGSVSAATWAIASTTTLIRSFTTIVQTGDVAVLLNFSLSFCLNAFMVILILYFHARKNKQD